MRIPLRSVIWMWVEIGGKRYFVLGKCSFCDDDAIVMWTRDAREYYLCHRHYEIVTSKGWDALKEEGELPKIEVEYYRELYEKSNENAVLKILEDHGEMTSKDIANILGISSSTVNGILRKLRNAGLVERVPIDRKVGVWRKVKS